MRYKNILIIDDDEDDQELFITALDQLGLEINYNTSNSAQKSLNQLSKKEVEPDLIFLDLNMPIMTGQQFLAAVKKDEKLRQIPVIIFSTTTHQPTIELMKELGAIDFVTKPANFFDLVTILERILIDKQ